MADPVADTASVQMPAVRLRKGDGLPVYGAEAKVTRHPVISVDGSMINVLVASTAEEQSRLVRLPVGLRIDVVRRIAGTDTPAESGSAGFVRSTKVAKSSGARIAVLDLLHPDAEVPAEHGEKFATLCTVHHTLKTHTGISTAQAQATHPEQWCTGCSAAAADLARERVWGAAPAAGVGEVTA